VLVEALDAEHVCREPRSRWWGCYPAVIDTRLGGQVVRHAPPCPDLLRTEVTQSSQESKAGQYCPPKLPKVINRQKEILPLP
jgi:hypothetical protein